jgi:uncharacterized protein YcbX
MTARGGLVRDRAFALVDPAGGYVNGKREPRIHRIRARYDDALTVATLFDAASGAQCTFELDSDVAELGPWFTRVLGRPVAVRSDADGGFPDDELAPGPTVVSTATLETVASWFPGLDADAMRRRLRTNIEVGGVPAFWEDHLFGAPGACAIRIGSVVLEGTNPCARCVVPSRDPESGEERKAFAKRVAERRAATLPPWSNRARFDHYYRLAVNTRPAPGNVGRTIRVGDEVALAGAG